MISPVGYVNFLHQDDGRVQHVAHAVAAGHTSIAQLYFRNLPWTKEVFRATRLLVEVATVIATAALLET